MRGVAWLMVLAGAFASACSPVFPVPPGGRVIVVTVENRSAGPAVLTIGAWSETDKVNGIVRPLQAVGVVQPASVVGGTKVDVKLGVPAGRDWAFFVNPGPTRGLLFTANDAPDATVVFKVVIEQNGEPYMWSPNDPGWNPPTPAVSP